MRRLLKTFSGFFLIPFFKWYLQKERTYKFEDIVVRVFPGVFHPGYFNSTLFLTRYLKALDLDGRNLLELGCGTGLIAIFASKRGAIVTASDISPTCIENTLSNADANGCKVRVIRSDLFDSISASFDFIVINPPYYPKAVKNERDLAWHCGPDFEYFKKLFRQLASHITASSVVVMVLTNGCDLQRITKIAASFNFKLTLAMEKNSLFDGKDYVFEINSISNFQSVL